MVWEAWRLSHQSYLELRMKWWLLRDWVRGAARATILIPGDHGSWLANRFFRVGYIRRSWIDAFSDCMSQTSWFRMESAQGKTNHHPDSNVLTVQIWWWHMVDGDASTWANEEMPRGDSGKDTTMPPFTPLMMFLQKSGIKMLSFQRFSSPYIM